MSRQGEIEAEAQRRCLAGGYSLDMEARRLSSFPDHDRRPLWRAHYLPEVLREREEQAAAKPPLPDWAGVALALLIAGSPVLVVLGAIFWHGGWR